ncbi:MAG TPA: hypothetical protein VEH27_00760 [Methylomirabilota bacterium]|nr:hypothetical protein [Methylomirabilota bacterium]
MNAHVIQIYERRKWRFAQVPITSKVEALAELDRIRKLFQTNKYRLVSGDVKPVKEKGKK